MRAKLLKAANLFIRTLLARVSYICTNLQPCYQIHKNTTKMNVTLNTITKNAYSLCNEINLMKFYFIFDNFHFKKSRACL